MAEDVKCALEIDWAVLGLEQAAVVAKAALEHDHSFDTSRFAPKKAAAALETEPLECPARGQMRVHVPANAGRWIVLEHGRANAARTRRSTIADRVTAAEQPLRR